MNWRRRTEAEQRQKVVKVLTALPETKVVGPTTRELRGDMELQSSPAQPR